jgi:hypothetical protein
MLKKAQATRNILDFLKYILYFLILFLPFLIAIPSARKPNKKLLKRKHVLIKHAHVA